MKILLSILVLGSRLLRRAFDLSPAASTLKTKSESKILNWLKSLAAIHDLDRLVELDVPWWPYNVIDEIEMRFFNKKVSVFEWGSGASTIWLRKRGYSVTSVEHDQDWAERVRKKANLMGLDVNLQVKLPKQSKHPLINSEKVGFENLDFTDYVQIIDEYEKFDFIVIDGRARKFCLEKSFQHLNNGGVILFDNSNRGRYEVELKQLLATQNGIKITNFRGLTPASPLWTQSSLITLD